jgi:hypothetical protein
VTTPLATGTPGRPARVKYQPGHAPLGSSSAIVIRTESAGLEDGFATGKELTALDEH